MEGEDKREGIVDLTERQTNRRVGIDPNRDATRLGRDSAGKEQNRNDEVASVHAFRSKKSHTRISTLEAILQKRTLNHMKLPIFFLALTLPLALTAAASEENGWVETYGRLLNTYVTSSGVKYAEWKKNSADVKSIAEVTDAIGKTSVESMNKNDQLAFYINAYNAWILHGALEKYPTSSVKDLFFRFFTADNIRVAGKQTSFKKLEDEVIRGKFHNPGVHFALNCASRSCPPLSREPFKGDGLDAQTRRARACFHQLRERRAL